MIDSIQLYSKKSSESKLAFHVFLQPSQWIILLLSTKEHQILELTYVNTCHRGHVDGGWTRATQHHQSHSTANRRHRHGNGFFFLLAFTLAEETHSSVNPNKNKENPKTAHTQIIPFSIEHINTNNCTAVAKKPSIGGVCWARWWWRPFAKYGVSVFVCWAFDVIRRWIRNTHTHRTW